MFYPNDQDNLQRQTLIPEAKNPNDHHHYGTSQPAKRQSTIGMKAHRERSKRSETKVLSIDRSMLMSFFYPVDKIITRGPLISLLKDHRRRCGGQIDSQPARRMGDLAIKWSAVPPKNFTLETVRVSIAQISWSFPWLAIASPPTNFLRKSNHFCFLPVFVGGIYNARMYLNLRVHYSKFYWGATLWAVL